MKAKKVLKIKDWIVINNNVFIPLAISKTKLLLIKEGEKNVEQKISDAIVYAEKCVAESLDSLTEKYFEPYSYKSINAGFKADRDEIEASPFYISKWDYVLPLHSQAIEYHNYLVKESIKVVNAIISCY